MKKICITLTFLLATTIVSSQNVDLIINSQSRNTTSLNGAWQTIVDPYETGYYDYRYQPSSNGFFINRKASSKTNRVEYDFDKSETLHVPGDWNSQRENLFFYEGTIWYKKDFDYHKKPDTRLFVYFGAANYEAKVYLNGRKLGEHIGGFTPFNFEITDFVREKDNFLILKVDNRRHLQAVPTMNTDWWNYGGLTRDVKLIEVPDTFIRDCLIQLEKGSQNRVAGWVQLDGNQMQQKVTVRIREAGIETTIMTNKNGYAKFDFEADLILWSPEQPKLYTVEILSETDSVTDRIGFRSIETRGTDILLNGKPIFLRGICIHEQSPLHPGRAYSSEDARTLLSWVRELNANFVRLAHYPHNEHITRLADEMGILVWAEIPVYWTIQWENEGTLINAKNQLTEMIARDKNKASIIFWSISNETPLSDPRLNFLVTLAKHARQKDPTRLITAALEHHYINENTLMIDDPFGEYLDVIGINEYIGWYDGLPEKADCLSWETIYDKPLIISEFGAGAKQGNHGDSLTIWTEEYQVNVYKNQLEMLKRIPFLMGVTPWILMDFQSPRRLLPGIQDYWNRKGLISNQGIKKQAFFVLKHFYDEIQEKYEKKK